jgi:geranylgeranyl diphosphate synthase type I
MTDLTKQMFNAIEKDLQQQVAQLDHKHTLEYFNMLTYHMGWTGDGSGVEATGKRLRPLLVLLSKASILANEKEEIGEWESAVPAASAIELIHNFSLIHDDIQDRSEKRRGRNTVWTKWGIPQGINAGDGLFVLANLSVFKMSGKHPSDRINRVSELIQKTCLDLTRGQFMDISYETRTDLTVENYWPMISGKTAALISCCTAIGAILAGTDESTIEAFQSYGQYLGLAFQVQDDILGIWGKEEKTGKSIASDLIERKKSLPVLISLEKKGDFFERWQKGAFKPEEIRELSELLVRDGTLLKATEIAEQMTDLAINNLRMANPRGVAGQILFDMTDKLLNREH